MMNIVVLWPTINVANWLWELTLRNLFMNKASVDLCLLQSGFGTGLGGLICMISLN